MVRAFGHGTGALRRCRECPVPSTPPLPRKQAAALGSKHEVSELHTALKGKALDSWRARAMDVVLKGWCVCTVRV